jgi:hypothetical protein
MLFPVVVTCAFGLGTTESRADEAEDRAARLVTRALGEVFRDEKPAGKPVVKVQFYFREGADAGLRGLACLKHLRELGLNFSDTSDEGLKELVRLKILTTLNISFTEITDEGLKELASLKQLRNLDLQGTEVTEVGVARLRAALPKCQIDWP